MEPFCASWKLAEAENLAKYLKAVGLEDEFVQIGNVIKPVITFSMDRDKVVLKTVTCLSSTSRDISFNLNEVFNETTADNRQVKSTVYLKGAKLVHVQKWKDKQSTITRVVKGNQLIATMECGGVVAVCTYRRV